jgi:hypothetical protein
MWVLLWVKLYWHRLFSENFGFVLSVSLHQHSVLMLFLILSWSEGQAGQVCEPSRKGDADSDIREHRTGRCFDIVYIALSVFQRVKAVTAGDRTVGVTSNDKLPVPDLIVLKESDGTRFVLKCAKDDVCCWCSYGHDYPKALIYAPVVFLKKWP